MSSAKFSPLFVLIAALFATCLIVSNIVVAKLIALGDLIVITGGMVIFLLSYIFADILTEVYGYAAARLVIWGGFLCNLFAVGIFALVGALPAAPDWHNQIAYDTILGSTPLVLFASFLAYLLGELLNSLVLAKMKVATKGRFLWLRTIASTIVGEGIDTTIFILIVFSTFMPLSALPAIIVTQWLLKVGYEVLATPLTYIIVTFLKRIEGVDVYDHNLSFHPLDILGIARKGQVENKAVSA